MTYGPVRHADNETDLNSEAVSHPAENGLHSDWFRV